MAIVVTLRVPETPPGVDIRPASRADLLAVYRIERSSFSQPWPFVAFERYLDAAGFFVAEDVTVAAERRAADGPDLDGGVVGFVVADVTPTYHAPIGHIKDIAVDPDHRRNGLGRTLLRSGIAACRAEGARQIKLEVRVGNDRAIELYRAHGFRPLRRIDSYYEDGEDALVMVRDSTDNSDEK